MGGEGPNFQMSEITKFLGGKAGEFLTEFTELTELGRGGKAGEF